MRHLTLLLLTLVSFCISAEAQKQVEVVYLKNGSMIKGTVLEQNYSSNTIKVQTYDGSVFVYQMSDVEKVAKEATQSKDNRYDNTNDENDIVYPNRGFRFIMGVNTGASIADEYWKTCYYATWGGQIIPQLYIGAGVQLGVAFDSGGSAIAMTPYGNVRADFIKKKISPIVDVKMGASFIDWEGFYGSWAAGVRINHCTFLLGYDLQCYKSYDRYYYEATEFTGTLFFGVAFDFGSRH